MRMQKSQNFSTNVSLVTQNIDFVKISTYISSTIDSIKVFFAYFDYLKSLRQKPSLR